MTALKVEALKRGIHVPVKRRWNPPSLEIYRIAKVTWRHEVFTVRGRLQTRFRDLKTGRYVKNPSRNISNGKEVEPNW